MIPNKIDQYKTVVSDTVSTKSENLVSNTSNVEVQLIQLQQQVSKMAADLEFFNKERNRMKADIQMLASALSKIL